MNRKPSRTVASIARQMQIVFLGTSGSWPTPKRNVSAIAVKRGPEVLLFDCGEGTQRQFMLSSLSFMQVSRVFLTHFHGDHFLGLPGLVQSMTMNERREDLDVYGPRGTRELVKTLVTLGHFTAGFRVEPRDLRDGEEVDFNAYRVRAIEADHTVPALSYVLEEAPRPGRFDVEKARRLGVPEGPLYSQLQSGHPVAVGDRTVGPQDVVGPPRPGRKIAYTGDTRPSARLAQAAWNCDVLIHDATADTALEEKALRYGHSTGAQAALVAKECNARTLILTHVSPRYDDVSGILAEARTIFPSTQFAEDFFTYTVPYAD